MISSIFRTEVNLEMISFCSGVLTLVWRDRRLLLGHLLACWSGSYSFWKNNFLKFFFAWNTYLNIGDRFTSWWNFFLSMDSRNFVVQFLSFPRSERSEKVTSVIKWRFTIIFARENRRCVWKCFSCDYLFENHFFRKNIWNKNDIIFNFE